MKWIIVLVLLLVGYPGAAQKVNKELKPFAVLLGKWQMETKKGAIIEEWQLADQSALQGKSYRVTPSGDTLLLETINIRAEGRDVFYVPTVTGQNDVRPVRFKLIKSEAGKWVFENKEHDFPQQIVYWLKGRGQLLAWIEGHKNGKYSKSEFLYRRN